MTAEALSKFATAAIGGLLIAMQGLNLSEMGTVSEEGRQRAEALKGMEKVLAGLETSAQNEIATLQNQGKILSEVEKSLDNQVKILEANNTSINQNSTILANVDKSNKQNSDILIGLDSSLNNDSKQLQNQARILELLEKNLEAHKQ